MKLFLWSLRSSPARGNHWVKEREVTESNCQSWLKVFRDDEPGVIFICNSRKPPL